MLRLMERQRLPRIPELFLGLAAIGIAVVLTAKIAAGAIHDARYRGDTITVTGSAHEPITSNLVRWAVTDSAVAATASEAAGTLEGDLAATRKFLGAAGVPDVAMSLGVASTEELVERLPKHQKRVTYRVSQTINVTTGKIDVVQRVSTRLAELIQQGVGVSADPVEYLSTELNEQKFMALAAATTDARRRADILVRGLGGSLGGMRSSSLGVFQITPRNSTDVSDYGINDTSTRDKQVTAVVSATFDVKQ